MLDFLYNQKSYSMRYRRRLLKIVIDNVKILLFLTVKYTINYIILNIKEYCNYFWEDGSIYQFYNLWDKEL